MTCQLAVIGQGTMPRIPQLLPISGRNIPLITRFLVLFMAISGLAMPNMALAQSSDSTPEAGDNYFGAIPWERPEDAEEMLVHKVVDGDTLQLTYPGNDYYYPTRLVGIQAPEMDGPYTDEQCYGPEAKKFVQDLLPVGTEVLVQQDISNEDRNGRRLRHVFVIDPETKDLYLLSEVLVLGGFAVAREYPPDDLYDDVLAEAQEIADQEDAGLWDACER
jgi:endonuclease YncB( thermonuclease family)